MFAVASAHTSVVQPFPVIYDFFESTLVQSITATGHFRTCCSSK